MILDHDEHQAICYIIQEFDERMLRSFLVGKKVLLRQSLQNASRGNFRT